MENTTLERQGEIFVLKKCTESGWKIEPDVAKCSWLLEKDGRVIKIQIKTCLKRFNFSLNKFYDYIILTNLRDNYIIPKVLFNKSNTFAGTFKRCNTFSLLDVEKYHLLCLLTDLGIKYSKIEDISSFLQNCRNF